MAKLAAFSTGIHEEFRGYIGNLFLATGKVGICQQTICQQKSARIPVEIMVDKNSWPRSMIFGNLTKFSNYIQC